MWYDSCVLSSIWPLNNSIYNLLLVRYGHLLVSDFSDSITSIPHENLQQFVGIPGMVREGMQDENQFANPHGNGHAPRGVANRNALAVLFESMLPWVTYEDGEDGGPDDNHLVDRGQDNQ